MKLKAMCTAAETGHTAKWSAAVVHRRSQRWWGTPEGGAGASDSTEDRLHVSISGGVTSGRRPAAGACGAQRGPQGG